MPSDALPTPSQTVGPFFLAGHVWEDGPDVVADSFAGAVTLTGSVVDGDDAPVDDALVEVVLVPPTGTWGDGQVPPGFRGYGRARTDEQGRFAFRIAKPGTMADDAEVHAPHVLISVFARGLNDRLVTRVYFPDEPEANRADPVLSAVESNARASLIAERSGDRLVFDIHLQGRRQTPFFTF